MNDIVKLKLMKYDVSFECLIWYDGYRMLINKDNKILLLWSDSKNDYEEWFYIKYTDKLYEDLKDNKITLRSAVRLFGKTCKIDFKNVFDVGALPLSEYTLPDFGSFMKGDLR